MKQELNDLKKEVSKLVKAHDDHDKLTTKLMTSQKILNAGAGVFGLVVTLLLFMFSQLMPLLLEIIKK